MGVAFFAETAALSQVWLFWVAPIIGAVIGAVIYKLMAKDAQIEEDTIKKLTTCELFFIHPELSIASFDGR